MTRVCAKSVGSCLVRARCELLLLVLAPQNTDLVTTQVLGLKMVLYRVDALNFIFSLAFLIAAVLNGIYALHSDDRIQDGAALFYAGAAVAATLAGRAGRRQSRQPIARIHISNIPQ